jgi:hypothetical protein
VKEIMGQDLVVHFRYKGSLRRKRIKLDPIQANKERSAWSQEYEDSNAEDIIHSQQADAEQAKENLVELANFPYRFSEYKDSQQTYKRIFESIVKKGEDKFPMIHVSLSLGSGNAWPVYIRLFGIAQYLQTQDEELKQTLVKIFPPK